jgi:hypothetical protein
MWRLTTLLVFSMGAALPSNAWTPARPRAVSVCDLERDPKQYDGQAIEVRGRVVLGFEGFYLDDPGCPGSTARSVWLAFGGDVETPTIYCCGSHERKKGVTTRIEGHTISLVKDKLLDNFLRYLKAERLTMPNGDYCMGTLCHFYNVTATLRGRFFAGEEINLGNGRHELGGYGHFGCCHLLAIEQVSSVSATRTQVPAGGEFSCSTETWNPAPAEEERLRTSFECDKQPDQACAAAKMTGFREIARHWDDTPDLEGGHTRLSTWTAADLLNSYWIDMRTGKQGEAPPPISVTREHCRPTSPETGPKSLKERVSCQSYELPGTYAETEAHAQNEAKSIYRQVADRKQLWRLDESPAVAGQILKKKARQWHINPDSRLLFKCQKVSPEIDPDQVTSCAWHTPDQMQSFHVALTKFGFLKEPGANWNRVPWVETQVGATLCRTEGPQ